MPPTDLAGSAATGGRLTCVGDVMVDVRVALPGPLAVGSDTPAVIQVGPGGSAANTAAWAGSLGAAVRFFGRVGQDLHGADAEVGLQAAGVEVHLGRDAAEPTGTCVVLTTPDGERTMIPSAGSNERLGDADLAAAEFTAGDHLHVSGYALLRARSRPAVAALMARAGAAGATVSVDASSADPLRRVGADAFLGWLPAGCLLIANADEAAALTRAADLDQAARQLRAAGVARVVLKAGAGGAVVADERGFERVAAATVEAVDTTGAGDAFAAGLLVGLVAGEELAGAAERGNALAAQAVVGWGGRPIA